MTISVQPDPIYAGANGELFCVDPTTGTVRWKNRLKGLGMSIVAFDDSTTATIIAAAAAAQAALKLQQDGFDPALIVGHDDLHELCRKVGCFSDDPHARLGPRGARHDAKRP